MQDVRDLCWPGFQQLTDVTGNNFTCNIWPDRLSDCRINGRLVNEIRFRLAKRRLWRTARATMSPGELRTRLRRTA